MYACFAYKVSQAKPLKKKRIYGMKQHIMKVILQHI